MELVCINDHLYTFCETDKFKKYVRQAVNDQLFFSTFINQLNMNQLIKEELTRQIPGLIKTEAQLASKSVTDKRLDNFIEKQLGSYIANELNKQIPGYLNNNSQMQQILSLHSSNLNQQLLVSATNTLNQLVNEPQYQMVTVSHLNAMQQKCDHQRSEFQMQQDQQLNKQKAVFNSQLNEMKNDYQRQMDQLKTNLAKLDNLEIKINQLDTHNSHLQWALSGVSV